MPSLLTRIICLLPRPQLGLEPEPAAPLEPEGHAGRDLHSKGARQQSGRLRRRRQRSEPVLLVITLAAHNDIVAAGLCGTAWLSAHPKVDLLARLGGHDRLRNCDHRLMTQVTALHLNIRGIHPRLIVFLAGGHIGPSEPLVVALVIPLRGISHLGRELAHACKLLCCVPSSPTIDDMRNCTRGRLARPLLLKVIRNRRQRHSEDAECLLLHVNWIGLLNIGR